MAQSGISYAAGQLLAVVAPRTVLVVDAPTDWSLAGPLWELALDDAPVDEILDVLVRRGIRTAPSFAIVRVEGDAVRALVRGSVPVCFERTGEPVRLDATGATTWLEGLISGARRVLVGDVETTTDLPYLVSTGVVLVSGLALPCGTGAGAPDASGELPQVEDIDPDGGSAAPVEEPPVPAGQPYVPVAAAAPRVVDLTRTAPRTPAEAFAAAEPAAAPASARAFAPAGSPAGTEIGGGGLNGHVPAVFDRSFEGESFEGDSYGSYEPAPAAFGEYAPPREESEAEALAEEPAADEPAESPQPVVGSRRFDPEAPVEAATDTDLATEAEDESDLEDDTDLEDDLEDDTELSETDLEPTVFDEAAPADTDTDTDPEPARDYHPPYVPESAAEAAEVGYEYRPQPAEEAGSPSFFEAAAPELQDEQAQQDEQDDEEDDEPAATPQLEEGFDERFEPQFVDRFEASEQPHDPEPADGPADPFDDLLIDADERPPGPSPVDLPNFASPSVPVPPSAQHPPVVEEYDAAQEYADEYTDEADADEDDRSRTGFEFPQQSRIGSAPAAWPPPPAEQQAPAARVNGSFEPEPEVGFDSLLADGFRPPATPGREPQHQPGARDLDAYDPLEAYQPDTSDDAEDEDDDPAAGSLPFRVRGQSLRPEQRQPLDQRRGLGGGGLSGLSGLNGRSAGNRELPPRPEPRPEPPRPEPPRTDEPAAAPAFGGPAKPQVSPSPSPSGGLLLPSFFRGARAARKSGPAETDQPVARDGVNGTGNGNGNGQPWPAAAPQSPPSAWAPPVRRGPGADQRPDGPPAMPGVLRQAPGSAPQGGPGDNEPPREPPRLLGVWCDAGHVTSPDHDTCRVCGLPVPPQAPILVARPPLGVLVFDNGDRVEVDRPVVLGRDPKPVSSPDPEPPVLHPVASATGQVSRTHAEVRAAGWDVVLTDLDAMNGTALTLPGQPPVAIEPGVATVIVPGARVDLGGETGFVFEIEG